MVARVSRATLLQQDRLPISTLEQATWRLVAIRGDESLPDAAYDVALKIVADIFWTSEKKLRRDVLVMAKRNGGA